MESKKDVIVIGAGLGGLSAALRLAIAGYNVRLFEQGDKAGGKAGELYSNGFRFDTGPSLLTMVFVLKQLFADSGEDAEEYLKLEKLKISCKYFWEDGTVINAYSDLLKFANEIEYKTSDSARKITEYLEYSKTIYDLTANMFLFSPFSGKDLIKADTFKKLPYIRKIDLFRTMHKANKKFFDDPKTIQLFDRYATYNGSNPYKAPATLNVIQHVEYNLGAYYAKDGMYSVVTAVEKLAIKNGVQINYNTPVKKILVNNNGVNGVLAEINGREVVIKSDIIISNADATYTYNNLLDKKKANENRINKRGPSSSALVFYWGVKEAHESLETHNILFSENYKKEFDDIFKNNKAPDDPTVYIYISSKFNNSDAPSGSENWFVMINTPYNNGHDWQSETVRMRSVILNKILRTTGIDISDKIISENIMTPRDIEKSTSGSHGSIYGISSNSKAAAFLRQKNRSDIKGLYFCGGSAHPGGGIPLVLSSGKIVADMIINND